MNEYSTMDNMSEVVKKGFKSKQEAINYVAAYPEKHMPSFFVKEVREYELWDCFVKQIKGKKDKKRERDE